MHYPECSQIKHPLCSPMPKDIYNCVRVTGSNTYTYFESRAKIYRINNFLHLPNFSLFTLFAFYKYQICIVPPNIMWRTKFQPLLLIFTSKYMNERLDDDDDPILTQTLGYSTGITPSNDRVRMIRRDASIDDNIFLSF